MAKDAAVPATPAPNAVPAPTPLSEPGEIQIMPDDAPAGAVGQLPMEEFARALGIPKDEPDVPAEPEPAPEMLPDGETVEEVAEELEGDVVEGEPVEEEPAPAPEGSAPEGQTEQERQLAAKFAIHDAEGELEIPDLYLSFKANNKDYEKVPLDKVVRLAQMGVYQHDREQQLAQREQHAQQAHLAANQLAQKVQQLESFYDRVFRDPSFYDEAQQLYLKQHTPESRAARAEAAERHAREQLSRQNEERFAATFVSQQLSPALERLTQQNPLVDVREVFGQFSYLTAPLLDRGRVPAGRLQAVAQLVQSELVPWVERLQATRAAEQQTHATQVAQAKQQAALAKRHLARRVASPPGAAPGAPNDKPRDFESVSDWLEADMGGSLR